MANITDFIHINAAGLAELVNQRLRPLHDPARDELHRGIAKLLRSPKGPQGHLITGAVKALKRQKDIVWAMSMGTGKSYCSIATTHCMAEGKPYTAIVVCPPHLVGKWEREVEATVKGPRVIQVRDWKEWLFVSRLRKDQITQPTWIITPISTAKLGGRWQPAAVTPHCLGDSPLCPQCFAPVIGEKKEPATHDWLSASKRFCPHCRSPLFGYQGQHYYEGSKLVKKHMRWLKPTLILDEAHQAKSATTFAGLALGHLIAAAHKVMLLTGTLIAGKSEDLRPTYFRLFPQRFIEQGLGWKDETEFAKRYGRMETKVKYTTKDPGLAKEITKKSGTVRKVRPGIMPQLFRDFIADRTIFCSLKEMKIALPELKETVTPITMAPEQAAEYHHMSDKLLYQFNRLMHTDRPMAMRYLAPVAEALMTWPDDPCSTWPSIGYKDWDGQFRAIYEPKPIPEQITPKEEELFRIIDQNKAEGRQCWLFSTRIDTTERIRTLASRRNLSCGCLHASVHPVKREQWIAEQAPDMDCIISHPKLIETGIDLFSTTGMGPRKRPYNMCTLIWLSTGMELNTLRQASARHWRIGQPLECRTHFLYYRDTAQQHAITLMAKKLLAAEYLEGNMEGGGLMEESGETSMELAIVRQMAAGVSAMVPEYFNAV